MADYTVNAYNNGGTGGSVNMRKGAGTNYDIVVQVPHGATVTGTKSGDWSFMTYGSKSGYMMSVYLDAQSGGGAVVGNHTNINGWIEVTKTDVNVRETVPNGSILYRVSSPTQSVVSDKTTAVTDGVTYQWYKIKPGTTSGWIRGDMCKNIATPGNPGGGTNPGTYTAGNIGKLIKTGVNVREDSKKSSPTMGEFKSGTKFVIAGTKTGDTVDNSNVWVAVYFGTASGTVLTKYIHSSCIEDQGYGSSYNAKSRFLEIAMSQTGLTGNLLGLGGQWCQNWMSWLGAATGRKPSSLPYSASYVSDGMNYFGTKYWLGTAPQVGDWVYYSPSGSSNVSHVGLVTSINTTARTFSTHEGSLSAGKPVSGGDAFVSNATVSYIDGKGATDRVVYCFVRPTYN